MKNKKPITLRDDGYQGLVVLLDGQPVARIEMGVRYCDSAWLEIEVLQKSKVDVRNKRGLPSYDETVQVVK